MPSNLFDGLLIEGCWLSERNRDSRGSRDLACFIDLRTSVAATVPMESFLGRPRFFFSAAFPVIPMTTLPLVRLAGSALSELSGSGLSGPAAFLSFSATGT